MFRNSVLRAPYSVLRNCVVVRSVLNGVMVEIKDTFCSRKRSGAPTFKTQQPGITNDLRRSKATEELVLCFLVRRDGGKRGIP